MTLVLEFTVTVKDYLDIGDRKKNVIYTKVGRYWGKRAFEAMAKIKNKEQVVAVVVTRPSFSISMPATRGITRYQIGRVELIGRCFFPPPNMSEKEAKKHPSSMCYAFHIKRCHYDDGCCCGSV